MSRGRRRAVKALVVLGSVLAFLSVFAIWVERQALNTDDWVYDQRPAARTTRRSARALADYLVDQLYENVNVEKELKEILPGETKQFAGPAAGGLRQVAGDGAEKVLETSTAQVTLEGSQPDRARTAARSPRKQEGSGLDRRRRTSPSTSAACSRTSPARSGIGADLAEKLPPDAGQIDDPPAPNQLKTAQNIDGRGQGAGAAALDPHLRRLRAGDLLLPRRALGDRALLRHRADRRRLRGDRRPPHRRRDRRRPAGHRQTASSRRPKPPGRSPPR